MSHADLPSATGPSLLLCTGGKGVIRTATKVDKLRFGSVFYIGCGTPVSLTSDGGRSCML